MPKHRPLLNHLFNGFNAVYYEFPELIKWSIALAIIYLGIDAANSPDKRFQP